LYIITFSSLIEVNVNLNLNENISHLDLQVYVFYYDNKIPFSHVMVLVMKQSLLLLLILLTACNSDTQDKVTPNLKSSPHTPQLSLAEEVTTTARSFSYLKSPAILIFSETRDWRHEEGIAGANLAIMKVAKELELNYFTTEHSGVFNAKDLERFDVVVFNNMTGNALTPQEKENFEIWQAKGNGTLLIHGAGDSSHQNWNFYHNELIGSKFVSHIMAPQFQEARVEVLNRQHPVMTGMPKEFFATDEWYTFESPPNDNFILLAGLDESSYSPVNTVYGDVSDLRMGPKPSDHPIIWARCHGDNQARSVYTAMGHQYESYEKKESVLILKNALQWVSKKNDPQSQGCIRN